MVLKGSESSTGYVRKAQTPMTLHPSGLSRQIYATRKGFLSPPKSRLVQVSSQLVTRDPLLPENALAKKKKKKKNHQNVRNRLDRILIVPLDSVTYF